MHPLRHKTHSSIIAGTRTNQMVLLHMSIGSSVALNDRYMHVPSSGTALQQDFVIRKAGSKYFILATVHFALYFSFAVIISEINPTESVVLITRVSQLALFLMKFSVKPFMNWLSLKEKTSGLRLNFRSREIMDAIGRSKRHYSVHNVWCLDPENMKDFFERVWD